MPRARRERCARALFVLAAISAIATSAARSDEPPTVRVRSVDELRRATAAARPGTRIRVAAGSYAGAVFLEGLRGEAGKPIVIEAADPKDPPVFSGGSEGIHLVKPAYVEMRGLVFAGQSGNGMNIDDGGAGDGSAHHVVLADLAVRDVGPRGNHDGIKLSGLDDFRVEGCTVERWGTGGSAIDMVGCRRGAIERCAFRHTEGAEQGSGVQCKGGTRDVTLRRCRFEHAGGRAVNVGGSTGLEFFRPPLAAWKGPRFEAKDIVVEGCTFLGSTAPVAFVGADGATFRFNTVFEPGRWAMRILQETRAEGFVPCRGGVVADNVIAFRSDRWAEGGVNVGDATDPGSFRFARNVWFCVDAPARTQSLVRVPTKETDGVFGKDPLFRDATAGDVTVKPGGPAARAGADALPDAPSKPAR